MTKTVVLALAALLAACGTTPRPPIDLVGAAVYPLGATKIRAQGAVVDRDLIFQGVDFGRELKTLRRGA